MIECGLRDIALQGASGRLSGFLHDHTGSEQEEHIVLTLGCFFDTLTGDCNI